jgi:hypothetical protein
MLIHVFVQSWASVQLLFAYVGRKCASAYLFFAQEYWVITFKSTRLTCCNMLDLIANV